MRASLLLAAALAPVLFAASPAQAQTPPAELGARYVPAPWWMREPVIASIGHVRAELPANRAGFSATFQSVESTAAEATRKSADQVRALGRSLAAFGSDKVQVETTFHMRPLYDQYRDREGNLIDNQRADRVERYAVDAQVSVRVRDTALLERVYATVLAARPTSTQPVYFSLEPGNEALTAMHREAVADAALRARQAAESAGARLGAVKVIDPTARACQTDVLAGWPSYEADNQQARTVAAEEIVVTGSRGRPAPPPPPPPPPAAPGAPVADSLMQLPLQPPLQELTARACVVYSLG
jgi:hypothetical protein